METIITKRPIHTIAEDYFSYLGEHLPQQCASDEFYFFPRSEAANAHLTRLDDLSPDRLQDHVQALRKFLGEIQKVALDGLEDNIDCRLLTQSMKGIIREMEIAKVWQKDPTLYVKIPLFAVARVLMDVVGEAERLKSDLLNLFAQIPPFLSLAAKNLDAPSEISLKVALDMARDAVRFHEQDVQAFIKEKQGGDEELLSKNKKMSSAWARYVKDLTRLPHSPDFAIGEGLLKEILTVSLGYETSPNDILKNAQSVHEETQRKLRSLERTIERDESQQNILHKKQKEVTSSRGVVQLYRQEVQALRRFFYTEDCLPLPSHEKVTVLETPHYLRSLRATASYSAPLTGEPRDAGIFYITPGKGNLEMTVAHCSYLSAHETYPGHHLLDHLRIHQLNPVRRQIESPLFYEGWACYGEKLLDELGYISDPRQQVIGLKRQLWRDLRAQLDIKLQTGKIGFGQAVGEIESLGYSRQRAQRQVRRFCLTPGYQLCYFVGLYEITQLRNQYSSRMGTKGFHERLLEGGEIPFHLIEKRMKETLNEDG